MTDDHRPTPTEQWVSVWHDIFDRYGPTEASPVVVGVAGGVAAGKSTAADTLTYATDGTVTVMAMDDFLMPNIELAERGLSDEKGFPHTYNVDAALQCLADLAAGASAEVPVYSHERYDIVAEHRQVLSPADTLVVEGLHVLGDARLRGALTYGVFLRTDLDVARERYLRRFRSLRADAVNDPRSFYRWALEMDDATSEQLVADLWDSINLPNHQRFIANTEQWATYVVADRDDGSLELID